jgi:hypothetical protein
VSVRVSFNLDDADLEHLAAIAQQTQLRARSEPADAIIAGAREVLETANRAQLAGFVKERYSRLDTMLQMVCDTQWQLSAEDRQRALNALACFGSSTSAAPSGLLDHAIMIELTSANHASPTTGNILRRMRIAMAGCRRGARCCRRGCTSGAAGIWMERRAD